jgi:hypothetical protein
MATKKKIAREVNEANRLDNALVTLGASDFRPRAPYYTFRPADEFLREVIFAGDPHKVTPTENELIPNLPVYGIITVPPHGLPGTLAFEASLLPGYNPLLKRSWRVLNTPPKNATLTAYTRSCRIKPDGRVYENNLVMVHADKKWHPLTALTTDPDVPTAAAHVDILLALFIGAYRVWSVTFTLAGAPPIRVGVTAAGVKGLFTLREKDPTMSRRAALRHWVNEYVRRKSINDPATDTIDVRGHLKGRTEFEWFGMKCFVHPPVGLTV